MRYKTSYHIHTTYCDGKDSAEQMVLAALAKGFTHIGFASHAPVAPHHKEDMLMKKEDFYDYKKEVLRLQQNYKDKIEIFLGLEYDCYEGEGMAKEIDAKELDFFILSIHSLGIGKDKRPIDCSAKELEELFDLAGGDVQEIVKRYYALLGEAVIEERAPVVRHIDIIKKIIRAVGILTKKKIGTWILFKNALNKFDGQAVWWKSIPAGWYVTGKSAFILPMKYWKCCGIWISVLC